MQNAYGEWLSACMHSVLNESARVQLKTATTTSAETNGKQNNNSSKTKSKFSVSGFVHGRAGGWNSNKLNSYSCRFVFSRLIAHGQTGA